MEKPAYSYGKSPLDAGGSLAWRDGQGCSPGLLPPSAQSLTSLFPCLENWPDFFFVIVQWWLHDLFLFTYSAISRCALLMPQEKVPEASAIGQNLGFLRSGISHPTSEHIAGQAQSTVNL